MLSNSVLTWPKALSAVAISELACWLLLMPAFTPMMSDCKSCDAIKPAGSSAPLLIFRPVLKRVSAVFNWLFARDRFVWATSELTLVLITVMPDTPPDFYLVVVGRPRRN